MSYIHRQLENELKMGGRGFPVLILTGPRRSGKTTLLQKSFPGASYHLLEDIDTIDRIKSDPRTFVEALKLPVILDEIQNVPELFNYIRTRVDLSGRRKTEWFLTGSQEPALMKGVTESMSGRAAIFHLLPLSHAESSRVSMFRGGFPEIVTRRVQPETWFRSYIQTYLEKDIRAISSIRDLAAFRRFLSLAASRIGQVLNRTDLAGPLGISVPTVTEWINLLEATHQIIVVPPFFENFGKRIIKSPKIYFTDSGLAAYLLGIESERALARSTFLGPLFENFIAAEIVKTQLNFGKRKELYYFRDRPGLEVDFVVPAGDAKIVLFEAKASRTVRPEDAANILRLQKSMAKYRVSSFVIHLPDKSLDRLSALLPGARAVSYQKIPGILYPGLGQR